MKANEFLPRFNNVQSVKPEQWKARCPEHDDRHPSLVITVSNNRLLIHCRAGCRTSDVLEVVGLDYPDLFLDSGKTKGTKCRIGSRQPELVPWWDWNWRSQCAELERLIQAKRENAQALLAGMQGLDLDALSANEFDEVMSLVARAYDWRYRCDRLDETLYLLQQDFRAEERRVQKHTKTRKTVMA